ncbi:MAG: adaptor protein MecA [Clostridia bacterium]|nr:adaptor protein MecA [Clostridia bacterium]
MEFLLIGESKIKIVLNKDDTEKYRLDTASADVSGPSARRIFWRILEDAKREVGFDPAGDKVLIQIYPLKSGGCELFVNKLGILSESSARLVSKSDKVAMLSKKQTLYSFDCLDDIISAARAIKNVSGSISPYSDVYTEDGRYYLAIEEYGKGGEPVEFPCILEFGTGVTADLSIYISEHADRLTFGDGVEQFAGL